jgi:hypothetical protein
VSKYYGDFAAGSTVRIGFNTNDSSGLPTTLAGTPTLAVHKDGSTTQSTAGVSLTVDFDSLTGYHVAVIDLSADGTFYSSGSDFRVYLTAGTVGGTSVVGSLVGSFSIGNRSTAAIKAKTDNLPASFPANFADLAITATTGLVKVNLTEALSSPRALDSVADGSVTLNDALWCAVAAAAGKETISGTSYVVKTPFTGTVIRTFTLDSATSPTSRT